MVFGHNYSSSPTEIFTPENAYFHYVENHKQKLNQVYKNLQQKVQQTKEKAVARANVQGGTINDFKLNQTVLKENPKTPKTKNTTNSHQFVIKKIYSRIVQINNKKNTIVHEQNEVNCTNFTTDGPGAGKGNNKSTE